MSKKKKDKKSSSQKKTYKGAVELTRSGMAFVIVEGLTKDIMVKQKNLNTALDGDEVLVDVIRQAKGMGRMEGVVTDVLKRKKTEFTGTLQVSKNFAFLIPEKGMFMPDIYIPANALGEAKSGDKAVVKIVAWGEQSRKPVGEIVEILDASDTNDLAMKEILIESGFPLNFPKEVLAELDLLQEDISREVLAARKDCRKILTFTIDPADAKDFDDALSIRKLKNGHYEIGVHIADVSHYVVPGTELDKEAEKRATSVYLPDRVLPMLPEKISNELCSLRPHEDKLTFSAIFQMNEAGEVKQHWIGRTVIHSKHRFTYEEVQEVIEKGEGPFEEEVLLLNKIAQTLRKQRFVHGAINFSSQEVRFKLDETGKPVGIVIKESKEAHQLIEEFMLLANRTVAEYVSRIKVNKLPVPFPYRVHDTPDEEKLKVFAVFASKFGYKFDLHTPESIARSFNQMLQLVKGKPEQHVLETLGIRTMAKAIYTVDNVGHYGLGFEDYCHFTSPIRRYPDVMVHRVVEQCLAGNIVPDKQMERKCKHASEMERKAMDAERAANKYKQVEYMQQFIGDTFDGVVSGVAHFGFWVETVDTKCEGLVSIHNLMTKDEFMFSDSEYALIGLHTGKKYRIGEKVKIRVVSANLAKRQLDYDLEDELTNGQPVPQQGKRREEGRRKKESGNKRGLDKGRKKGSAGGGKWEYRDKRPTQPVAEEIKESIAPKHIEEIKREVVFPATTEVAPVIKTITDTPPEIKPAGAAPSAKQEKKAKKKTAPVAPAAVPVEKKAKKDKTKAVPVAQEVAVSVAKKVKALKAKEVAAAVQPAKKGKTVAAVTKKASADSVKAAAKAQTSTAATSGSTAKKTAAVKKTGQSVAKEGVAGKKKAASAKTKAAAPKKGTKGGKKA
ncbi:ribonuclease R [Chitinophaga defluvii]|uniref:Ribonuclease R n=1 Tax=Chitinophaga defluvii TaxID=3163343 RepID=A0ABV2T334_9BACT